MGHQVREYQRHRGIDINYEENESMHYNPSVDRQIRVPMGDINELRERLKEEQIDSYQNSLEAKEVKNGFSEEHTLTRKQKM